MTTGNLQQSYKINHNLPFGGGDVKGKGATKFLRLLIILNSHPPD